MLDINAIRVSIIYKAIEEIADKVISYTTSYERSVLEIPSCIGTFIYDGTGSEPTLSLHGDVLIANMLNVFKVGGDEWVWKASLRTWLCTNGTHIGLHRQLDDIEPNHGPVKISVDYEDLQLLLSLVQTSSPGKLPMYYTRLRNQSRAEMTSKIKELNKQDLDPLFKLAEAMRIEKLYNKCDGGTL